MQRLIIIYIFLIVSCQNKQKKPEVINAQDFWDIVCAINDKYPFIQDTTLNKIIFIDIKISKVKIEELVKIKTKCKKCLGHDITFLNHVPKLHEGIYSQVYVLNISEIDDNGVLFVFITNLTDLKRKWIPGDDPGTHWEYHLKKTNDEWKLIGGQKSLDAWDDIKVAPKRKH